MKKLFYILVLLTGIRGFAFPPPVINDPTPLVVCDSLNNNYEAFDLTIKIPEILGALNPNLYSINFYETQTDALAGANPISDINNFINIVPNFQTLYVRVQDTSDGSYSTTSLDLVLNPVPFILPINNLFVTSDSLGNYPTFDFLETYPDIFPNGQTGFGATWYHNLNDAQNMQCA